MSCKGFRNDVEGSGELETREEVREAITPGTETEGSRQWGQSNVQWNHGYVVGYFGAQSSLKIEELGQKLTGHLPRRQNSGIK